MLGGRLRIRISNGVNSCTKSDLGGCVNGIVTKVQGSYKGLVEWISAEYSFKTPCPKGPFLVGFQTKFFTEGGFTKIDKGS